MILLYCMVSISLVFGVVVAAAGLVGTIAGSLTATRLRLFTTDADPLVCAFSMLATVPFLFVATVFSATSVLWVSSAYLR